MLAVLRQRLTFANVVSLIALFVALGGSSYAAVALSTNSVKARHIAPNAVTSPKVRDSSLLARDFAPGQLPAGPQGEQGPPGLQGAKGDEGDPGAPGQDGQDGQDATAPANAVMYFNSSTCPQGWNELTSARGRYIVGMPSGGTLNGTAGTPLTDTENRSVGQHNHPVNDPGHSHDYNDSSPFTVFGGGWFAAGSNRDAGFQFAPRTTSPAQTGVTVGNAGSVAGTNAPYLQLLACEKQ